MKRIAGILILTIFLAAAAGAANAQNQHFTTSGVIEFDKTINIYALIKKEMWDDKDGSMEQQAFDIYKKAHPQFRVLKSTLTFGDNRSLFTPADEEEDEPNGWWDLEIAKQPNIVYTDLDNGHNVIQKQVFEQTYLLSDTTRKIHWKITDETREIAGYTCRRANAIVMDSIYVVAFYTDKIHVSGGPENFTGLPGMILGLALPHENVTWFATKVTDMTVDEKSITAPKKGKPMNQTQLKTTLKSAMQGWGKEANQNFKAFLL
jgi:GLPGLI family protein